MKMNSRNAFAKCRDDGFAICSLDVDKGWIGVEPADKSNGLYYYILKGSCKFGVPFKEGYDILKKGDFYCTKDKYHDHFLVEALEDFCMVGFSTLKNMDWDGRIVDGDTLKVDKDSILICYAGNPVVGNQELDMFDYGNVYAGQEYSIDVTSGVLGLFTMKDTEI